MDRWIVESIARTGCVWRSNLPNQVSGLGLFGRSRTFFFHTGDNNQAMLNAYMVYLFCNTYLFVWLYCTGLILRVSFPCTLCTITIHITIHRPKTSLSATNAPPCGSLSLRVYPSPMPGDIPLRMPHTGHCGYFDIFYGCFAGFRGPIWCSN